MTDKQPQGDWWYTDMPKPHMREVKPLDEGPARKRFPPDFQIAVDIERKLRRQMIIWRAIALVGVGYIAKDIARALGWF